MRRLSRRGAAVNRPAGVVRADELPHHPLLALRLREQQEGANPFRPAVVVTTKRVLQGSARIRPDGWVDVYDDTPIAPPARFTEAWEQEREDRRHAAEVERREQTLYHTLSPHQVESIRWTRADDEEITAMFAGEEGLR
jgi:hypothetical protein